MKHTISVVVDNKPGVLARIAGLFSARGFNIQSLAVGETEDPAVSRMTIIVDAADNRILEQIMKQLNRLIDTIRVIDVTRKDYVERELLLVKLARSPKTKTKIARLANTFGAEIVASKKSSCIVEICAEAARIKEFLDSIAECGIKTVTRTGRIAMLQ